MTEPVQNETDRTETVYDSIDYLRENQLEALRSLTELLVGVVELLRQMPNEVDELLGDGGVKLLERTQRYEADLIRAALIKTGGNQRQAAKLLGTKESTLNVKIKRYGIDAANQHSAPREEK